MTVLHKNLTGADLHEPKGAAGAASGQTYHADGAGSGAWRKSTPSDLDFSSLTNGQYVRVSSGAPAGVDLNNANLIYLNCYLANAANAKDAYVVCPQAGEITAIWTVIYDACDGNTIITSSIAGVNITDGSVTISAAGSAAGDVDSATPSANNDILAGQAIRFLSDGGATAALPVMITVEVNVA